MKNKLLSFLFVFVGVFFVFTGCSNDKNTNIKSIDLLKNSIETDYTVLDEVNIEDLLFVVSFNDDRVMTYDLSDTMFEHNQIDNTKVGKQDLVIKVNEDGYEEEFNITFNFKLPEEVQSINEEIMKLPISERLSFNDSSLLEDISNRYHKLQDKYKSYVIGYKDLEDKITYLGVKKQEVITTEVLTQRSVYISVLEKLVSSLNPSNYTLSAREQIDKIYVDAVKKLSDDDNYNIMYQIVNEAKENIMNVKTNKEEKLEVYQKYVINNLIDYKNSFNIKLYSNEAIVNFEFLLLEGIEAISNAINDVTVDYLFGEYCSKFNSILTIEKENVEALSNLIKDKLYETTQYFLAIDIHDYDYEGRQEIEVYLSNCQYKIKNAKDSETIDKAINDFEKKVSKVLTVSEKHAILFNEYKQNSKNEMAEFYNNINLYSYDTKNMIEIEKIYKEAVNDFDLCTTHSQIDSLVANTITKINSFLTLEQQATINLSSRINNYIEQVNIYVSKYDQADYSEVNWGIIASITSELKAYINNITISTSDKSVLAYMKNKYDLIAGVATIDEEYTVLLENTINNSIKQISDYYSNLNQSLYTESQLTFIKNKVDNVISIIETLDNVNSINKLVADTIESIQLV